MPQYWCRFCRAEIMVTAIKPGQSLEQSLTCPDCWRAEHFRKPAPEFESDAERKIVAVVSLVKSVLRLAVVAFAISRALETPEQTAAICLVLLTAHFLLGFMAKGWAD